MSPTRLRARTKASTSFGTEGPKLARVKPLSCLEELFKIKRRSRSFMSGSRLIRWRILVAVISPSKCGETAEFWKYRTSFIRCESSLNVPHVTIMTRLRPYVPLSKSHFPFSSCRRLGENLPSNAWKYPIAPRGLATAYFVWLLSSNLVVFQSIPGPFPRTPPALRPLGARSPGGWGFWGQASTSGCHPWCRAGNPPLPPPRPGWRAAGGVAFYPWLTKRSISNTHREYEARYVVKAPESRLLF